MAAQRPFKSYVTVRARVNPPFMKENILTLRAQGKSYSEIEKELGCSLSTIAYHCGEGQKQKRFLRNRMDRKSYIKKLKAEAGGKCTKCGYNKSLNSLHFHHVNDDKEGNVSRLAAMGCFARARAEARKCVLVCANCHGEIHEV